MRIAIVGSGNIGSGLGRAWAAKGHAVTFAARTTDEPEVVALALEIGAAVAPIADALAGAEVTVLAMPFAAAPAVAAALTSWQGRLVVDCTNPIGTRAGARACWLGRRRRPPLPRRMRTGCGKNRAKSCAPIFACRACRVTSSAASPQSRPPVGAGPRALDDSLFLC